MGNTKDFIWIFKTYRQRYEIASNNYISELDMSKLQYAINYKLNK